MFSLLAAADIGPSLCEWLLPEVTEIRQVDQKQTESHLKVQIGGILHTVVQTFGRVIKKFKK